MKNMASRSFIYHLTEKADWNRYTVPLYIIQWRNEYLCRSDLKSANEDWKN